MAEQFGTLYKVCKEHICGHEKCESDDEKKMNYCHCPLVRKYLKEGISPTFCYCGAGWYRQLWEGILAQPVKVEIVDTLLSGDTACRFAIHLPEGKK